MKIVWSPTKLVFPFYAGTGGIAKGQLGMLSSATVIDATAGQSTAVLLGIAVADYDAGEVAYLEDLRGSLIEMPIYQGGTTDVFADADIGKAFDMYVDSGVMKLDPNDTTGGMFVLYSYDNDAQTAIVRVLSSLLYLA